jgi:hypothetical protein
MITASVIVFGGAFWSKVAAASQQLLPNGKFNLHQILPSGQIFFKASETTRCEVRGES